MGGAEGLGDGNVKPFGADGEQRVGKGLALLRPRPAAGVPAEPARPAHLAPPEGIGEVACPVVGAVGVKRETGLGIALALPDLALRGHNVARVQLRRGTLPAVGRGRLVAIQEHVGDGAVRIEQAQRAAGVWQADLPDQIGHQWIRVTRPFGGRGLAKALAERQRLGGQPQALTGGDGQPAV